MNETLADGFRGIPALQGVVISQVYVFQLKLLQTSLNRLRDVIDFRNDFRSHEKLFSRDTALFDRRPKLRLCIVELGTIEMIVAELDGGLDCLNRCTINAAGAFLVPRSASWDGMRSTVFDTLPS